MQVLEKGTETSLSLDQWFQFQVSNHPEIPSLKNCPNLTAESPAGPKLSVQKAGNGLQITGENHHLIPRKNALVRVLSRVGLMSWL